jgi:hypothetical protein
MSEMQPVTYDQRYDNVLLGQIFLTPHLTVIDEYEAMVD